ncbi:HAD-IIB family hydrolase [Aporhodopirellula aestuarii]|uniref:HAD-IIB family hydrolase n=1 Tax=Aporhodopirellula aestuarii TaxID=2950107 RepID=A0ABT0U6Q0_9BACT|nr:HAD-IIB family hydrolase [Aporhodopirellula aestuarii]MCM2372482.1 HAD-IIB family hydrolase [Aporhodopirellula aestuarii]
MKLKQRPRVVATDLDGTFIPLDGDRESFEALEQIRGQLRERRLPLVYVSGRHLEYVFDGIIEDGLPVPDWILCDVGTSVYQNFLGQSEESSDKEHSPTQQSLAARFRRSEDFDARLDEIVGDADIERVRREIGDLPKFRLQEAFKQGKHKLSYYVPAESLEECQVAAQAYLDERSLPYGIISSVDPFNGDGLIDVLPRDASKAFALDWWCESQGYQHGEIVFCGDSGNDYAALVAGYCAVVVGNASRRLAVQVFDAHADRGWHDRLFLALKPSTAGVLEGLRWFGLVAGQDEAMVENCVAPMHWGAVPKGFQKVDFLVFAPAHESLAIELYECDEADDATPRQIEMKRDAEGFFRASDDACPIGTRYRLRLGSSATDVVPGPPVIPDPASRYQPDGVNAASQVVSNQFPWQHDDQPRAQRVEELIVYELHIGTFTDDGTFRSAIERLDELVDLGVTAIELMPIAQCPGRWNWGYDATYWFAPMSSLGTPDDLRRLVDAAHARGLHVFADVVYNHFGPEGNYWSNLGNYLSDRHGTPWGAAPNFDEGPEAQAIRRFVIDNAIYWLDEFHLDGLRVDAIHCMKDDSEEHITRQFGREVRQWSQSQGRRVWLIAETNVYDSSMTVPLEDGGCGFDAQWGDDFAHALLACVRAHDQLTVRRYHPYVDLARALQRGFVFQGDVRGDRGREEVSVATAERVDTSGLVYCIQNHDFIGNHPLGKRFHQITAPETQASAAVLLILSPSIPMLFMGEEFACEKPFAFFVDYGDESLRQAVIEGRRREYPQHDWSDGVLPTEEIAFHSARIGAIEDGDLAMRDWYREVIRVRKQYTRAGILAAANCLAITDIDRGVYSLKFTREGETLLVVCRLAESSEQVRPQADGMSEQEVAALLGMADGLPPCILDSRRRAGVTTEQPFELLPNHAAVFASSGA